MKLAFISIFLVVLMGCAQTGTSGNTVLESNDKAHIYQLIHDQVTTKSDARKVFGDPSDVDFDNAGNEKWTYTHLDRSSLIRNYIPVINFFSRGTKNIHKKLILIFNKDNGTLLRSVVSQNSGETKYGLID